MYLYCLVGSLWPYESVSSYDFNRYVDILVSIGGSANSPDIREVAIPLIRSGRSVPGSYPISFNTDSGDIGNSVGEVPAMSLANIDF